MSITAFDGDHGTRLPNSGLLYLKFKLLFFKSDLSRRRVLTQTDIVFVYIQLQEFLLDMLDCLPRLRLSDAQMRTIIFVLKEAGVKDVPSLKTVRRVQKKLRERVGFTTVRHVSNRGHIFYVNDIHAQISKVRLSNGTDVKSQITIFRTSPIPSYENIFTFIPNDPRSYLKHTRQTNGLKNLMQIIRLQWSWVPISNIIT